MQASGSASALVFLSITRIRHMRILHTPPAHGVGIRLTATGEGIISIGQGILILAIGTTILRIIRGIGHTITGDIIAGEVFRR